jgi:hypothetical protein
MLLLLSSTKMVDLNSYPGAYISDRHILWQTSSWRSTDAGDHLCDDWALLFGPRLRPLGPLEHLDGLAYLDGGGSKEPPPFSCL